MKKKFGFSMAEVLLAIGIAGVVAAITIPTLVVNVTKESNVIAFNKAYDNLQKNLTTLQAKKIYRSTLYNSSLNRSNTQTVKATAGSFLSKEYFKISQNCGTQNNSYAYPCFAKKYTSIEGSNVTVFKPSNTYSIQTQGGMSIAITPGNSSPATVYIDVNGPKKPNIGGRDMFMFKIYEDFTVDDINSISSSTRTSQKNKCKGNSFGFGCLSRLIDSKWKLDY